MTTATGAPGPGAHLTTAGALLQQPQAGAVINANDDCRELVGTPGESVTACSTAVGLHGTVTGTIAELGHSAVVAVWSRRGNRAVEALTAGVPSTGDETVKFAESDVMGDKDDKLVCLQITDVRGIPRVSGFDVVGSQGALLFHVSTGSAGNVTKAPEAGLYAWTTNKTGVSRALIQYVQGFWVVSSVATLPGRDLPDKVGAGLTPATTFA